MEWVLGSVQRSKQGTWPRRYYLLFPEERPSFLIRVHLEDTFNPQDTQKLHVTHY